MEIQNKTTPNTAKKTGRNDVKRQQIIFYISFAAIPILQFIIFYIFVNFKSFIFAFQKYDIYTGTYSYYGLENFKKFFTELFNGQILGVAFKNSLILYACSLLLCTTLALAFSNYIYKKCVGNTAFRILLYLPHIISSISIVTIYKYFVDGCIPIIWKGITGKEIQGLLVNLKLQFGTILFLALYLTFGNNVLIYTSSMSGISESIVESANLDGITPFKEFIHITLPSIFPTIVNFLVAGLALVFTDQMLLYNFYANLAETKLYTVGYYMYKEVQTADPAVFPYLSSIGLVLTLVLTGATLVVRYLLNKYGPSVE